MISIRGIGGVDAGFADRVEFTLCNERELNLVKVGKLGGAVGLLSVELSVFCAVF